MENSKGAGLKNAVRCTSRTEQGSENAGSAWGDRCSPAEDDESAEAEPGNAAEKEHGQLLRGLMGAGEVVKVEPLTL